MVEAVGAGVTDIRTGDRVAYCGGPPGSYAELRVMPADKLVKLPDGVSDRIRGDADAEGSHGPVSVSPDLSAQRRRDDSLPRRRGRSGARSRANGRARCGVTMIGTVGSDEKAALAKANGCAHTIVYTRENFVERVKEFTGRQGRSGGLRRDRQGHVPGVARLPETARHVRELRQLRRDRSRRSTSDCWRRKDRCTRPVRRSSRTRPRAPQLLAMADEMFALVRAGKIVSEARQTYALKDARAGASRSGSAQDDRGDAAAAVAK